MNKTFLQGRFTRGMVLFSLGRYHDALLEFSMSAVYGENLQKLKSQVSEVLKHLLIMYSKETEASDLDSWDPLSHGYLRSYFNTFIGGANKFGNNDAHNALIIKVRTMPMVFCILQFKSANRIKKKKNPITSERVTSFKIIVLNSKE